MVRQEDYSIGRAPATQTRRLKQFLFSVDQDLPVELQLQTRQRLKATKKDLQDIYARTRHIQQFHFNLNSYSEEQSLHSSRFKKQDIGRVCKAMNWTSGRTKRNRYSCDPITACCVVLKRLSSSTTWYDLEVVFGMRYSALSEVFWEVLERFVEVKGHLVTALQEGLLRSRAVMYGDAVKEAGAQLDSCVGFIDCTKIKMTRPGGRGSNQRACYSGHKRFHCLIYQTITTPDGLIFSLYGPEVGRRHDMTLLRNNGISERLQACLVINGRQFYIYGDTAYVLWPWLQTAYERLGASDAQAQFNTKMSIVRVSVEWNYKDMKQLWTRNAFSRLLQVRRFPVSLLYVASALLLNFKTCMESWGQVTHYFSCRPPSFEEYISL